MKEITFITFICCTLFCFCNPVNDQILALSEKEQEAWVKAQQIRKELLSGADFAQLASKYSADPGSANHGGKLGFMEKGQLVPEYEAAALNLSKGEISEPVKSKYGYHIIQLLEIKEGRFNTRHILLKP